MDYIRKNTLNGLIFCFVITLLAVPFSDSQAFNAKKKFKRKCSSCHSIGGGDLVGPDLKGISEKRSMEWLTLFIQSSTKLIESGDEQAVAVFKKYNEMTMPDQNFTKDEIKQLIQFIDGGNAPAVPAAKERSADSATPEEIEFGRALFLGSIRFEKGGPQCLACHSAGKTGPMGGGELGPNLSLIYNKMGDAGLSASLANIAFPTMVGPYQGKEFTKKEIFGLKAFLANVAKTEGEDESNNALQFAFFGLIGAVFMLFIVHLIWGYRKVKTRRPKF